MASRFFPSQKFKSSMLLIAGICATSLCLAKEERPYFNDRKVPENVEDVLAIEASLRKHLERTRKATVSITDGRGFGSGVIVNKEGLIMTAAHVSGSVGKKMTVIMEDGTKYKAIALGLDSETDAALIKITEKGEYPFVEVDLEKEENRSTKLGDWVYALGHSGGFDKARGSVVRLGRVVRINEGHPTFQSDCKLIGGDSGGPLFNMNGVLVGIHSRVGKVLDQNMHVASFDFAAKWDRMLKNEFIGTGPFAKKLIPGKGFLGIAVEASAGGLKITDIDEKGPCAEVDLQIGDVLVSVNGKKVVKRDDLVVILKGKKEGAEMELLVLRGGGKKKVKVALGRR